MDLLDNHEKESTNFINEIIEFLNKDILLNEIIFIAFKIVCIFLLTVLILIILKKVFSKLYRKDSFNNFRLSFIKKMIRGFIIFLGIMLSFYQIPVFKSVVVTLFASSGILALVIGFASQEAFSNIVSGIFIILFRPFKKGDIVKLISNNIIGSVEDITLRHTIIKTYENKRVIVPNTAINKEVIENADMIDKKTCRFFEVGISYDSDIDLAISIIKDEILKHPNYFDTRTDEQKENGTEEIIVRVVGYGESSINLKVAVWGEDAGKAFQFTCDLYKSVKERFDKEGIEIPYPHRTVIYKKESETI